ncbi:hypothetical protein MRB53_040714 [Persea americana]|nr:hypothetical protein MRB53_040714 [Persea americana]
MMLDAITPNSFAVSDNSSAPAAPTRDDVLDHMVLGCNLRLVHIYQQVCNAFRLEINHHQDEALLGSATTREEELIESRLLQVIQFLEHIMSKIHKARAVYFELQRSGTVDRWHTQNCSFSGYS